MSLCKKCLKAYKSYVKRRTKTRAVKPWPDWVYHDGSGSLCDKHASYQLASSAKRRSKMEKVIGDTKEILEIYKKCRAIQKETGIKMEVDHIIPINGKNVSGLHTAKNLQIITATQNRKKSNKYSI